MKFGALNFTPVAEAKTIVGAPVLETMRNHKLDLSVAKIDPKLSDTAAFCEQYQIDPQHAANCVIVEAKRGDIVKYAACIIQATRRADINGVVRRALDARKISFAPMDTAVKLTGMEFGAICAIGLPADWPILVDSGVAELDKAIVGSGIRQSKLLSSGKLLARLPNAEVIDLAKQ